MVILFQLISLILVFFDYWIDVQINNNRKIVSLIMQFIYIFILSIPIGMFVYISLIVLTIRFVEVQNNAISAFYLIILFFSTILFMIIILNKKDKQFNLANIILNKFIILKEIRAKNKWFGFKEAIGFILFFTAVLSLIIYLIFNSLINFEIVDSGIIYIIIVSFFISTFIYSESTADIIVRSLRQTALWVSLFLILITISFLQIFYLINDINNNQALVNLAILIFGLVFNMSTIADKLRVFFNEVTKEYYQEIMNNRKELHNKYSFEKDINNTKQLLIEFRLLWKKSNTKAKVKIIFFVGILPLLFIILFIIIQIFFRQLY